MRRIFSLKTMVSETSNFITMPSVYHTQEFAQRVSSSLKQSFGLWYKVLSDENGRQHPPHRTPEFLALYGYSESESFPESPLDTVHPEDRQSVRRILRQALVPENSGRIFEATFRVRTKQGTEKWINAQVQQMELVSEHSDDGDTPKTIHVLASMHVDVTAAQKAQDEFGRMQLFYETMLDAVPGFVFVKELLTNQSIVFRYVNKALASRFLNKDGTTISEADRYSIYGKSDSFFIQNDDQVRRFRETDLKVYMTGTPEFLPEEILGEGDLAIKLATVKVPFETGRWSKNGVAKRYVLGIAIDITHISALLEMVIAESEDGIYVKGDDGKYIQANSTFKTLLGVKHDVSLVGKTFSQTVREHCQHKVSSATLEKLIDEVESEDQSVVGGTELTAFRRALFHDNREWRTRKRYVKHPLSKHGVLLGISQDVLHHAKIEQLIVREMDLYACIKNECHQVVWCNRAYAARHGYNNIAEVYGKTDLDFWPHFPKQAEKYMADDRRIIELAKKRTDLYKKSDLEGLKQINEDLAQYRKITEPQRINEGMECELLTEKWPVLLNARWHVAVLFSDVTQRVKQLGVFQAYAFHCLKTDLAIASSARAWIKQSQDWVRSGKANIHSVLHGLKSAGEDIEIGLQRLEFHANHFVEIGSGLISPDSFEVINLHKTIADEIKVARRIYQNLEVTFDSRSVPESGTLVCGRGALVQAIIQELLRNSAKQIHKRLEWANNKDPVEQQDGRIVPTTLFAHGGGLICVTLNETTSNGVAYLEIAVSDNGIGACSSRHRKLFQTAIITNAQLTNQSLVQRGLSFVKWTISRHGGTYRYDERLVGSEHFPTFIFTLPVQVC